MINPVLFSNGWKQLNDRFGRTISDDIMAIYYDYLSDRMDDVAYTLAVRKCILESSFFPSALEILHQVKEEPKAIAQQDWDTLLEAVRKGQRSELTPLGQKALAAIGGRIVVDQADEVHAMPHLRRQFIEAFVTFHQSDDKRRFGGGQLPQLEANYAAN